LATSICSCLDVVNAWIAASCQRESSTSVCSVRGYTLRIILVQATLLAGYRLTASSNRICRRPLDLRQSITWESTGLSARNLLTDIRLHGSYVVLVANITEHRRRRARNHLPCCISINVLVDAPSQSIDSDIKMGVSNYFRLVSARDIQTWICKGRRRIECVLFSRRFNYDRRASPNG